MSVELSLVDEIAADEIDDRYRMDRRALHFADILVGMRVERFHDGELLTVDVTRVEGYRVFFDSHDGVASLINWPTATWHELFFIKVRADR